MGLLKYKKIYVMAPYHFTSGGPELSHQLVDYLRNNGRDAYIIYNRGKVIEAKDLEVTREYNKYNIKVAGDIEDSSSNVLVLPETCMNFIPKYVHIQICIWWMSVDNAFRFNSSFIDSFKLQTSIIGKLHVLRCFKAFENNYSMEKLKHEDYRLTHFYQSTYAQQFLYKQNFSRIIRLSDYINSEIIDNVDPTTNKENIILYNPCKGLNYTEKLMTQMPQYKFIPLRGLKRKELNKIFDRAKIYIDFGDFPGKDRLPREAVIHNCCLITGKFGASRYFEDLPIPDRYKFDMTKVNYESIKTRIDEIFNNYEKCIIDFAFMQECIKQEKEKFFEEIDNIFF